MSEKRKAARLDRAFLKALREEPCWDHVRFIDESIAARLGEQERPARSKDRFPGNWFHEDRHSSPAGKSTS